jgi:two-component system phosphate regulon response regulator PhoB
MLPSDLALSGAFAPPTPTGAGGDRAAGASADRAQPGGHGAGTALPPNGERILVVDDEPDIVALVAYHLAKTGYRVATAATGTDAIEQARRERPALVVLDLMLPDLSGFEVLERLRGDEATRQVAVLMLTARRDEPDRIRGLSLGADDYLAKPFSAPELVLRIGAILRRVAAQAVTPGGPAGGAAGGVEDVLTVGALRIDRAAMAVSVAGSASS